MTEEHWAEIGAALRKANEEKQPTEFENPFVEVTDPLWISIDSQRGSGKPHEFSWLTMKLFGWIFRIKAD